MGLDGLSSKYLKTQQDLNSSILAANNEIQAQKDNNQLIKEVQHLEKEQQIKVKNIRQEQQDEDIYLKYLQEEDEGDGQNDDHKNESKDDFSKDEKQHKRIIFKLNATQDKIEVFDRKLGIVLETFEIKDFINVIEKLKSANGLIVNKTV